VSFCLSSLALDVSFGGLEVADWAVPDAHARARNGGQLDGSRETLVALGIIVLEANLFAVSLQDVWRDNSRERKCSLARHRFWGSPYLEFDGLKEVALLLVEGVLEELLYVGSHAGCEE
jgi:hypothetical protein